MEKELNPIIIGGDHHNTLGVIRSLGERGVQSDLILVSQDKRTFVDYSKYVDVKEIIANDEDIVGCLLSKFVNKDGKPVVICCSDASSGQIDEHYDQLEGYFLLPGGGGKGVITPLMNKRLMAKLAVETGLTIPHSYYVEEVRSVDEIELPCIFKVVESRRGRKADIEIIRTKEDLSRILSQENGVNYQIQEFIEKEIEYQLIGCSTKDDVIIPGVSIILRPCKGSNTSFLHYVPLEQCFCDIEKCKEYVRRTGYYGLFSLEFLRDKSGRDYFMEINFRNDGNAICVTAAGISLPHIWYLDCLDRNYGDEVNNTVKPVYVMPDMAELKLLLTRQISLRQYIEDLKKTDRFMEFDSKDGKPFWALLKKEIIRW